jgi:hypothetical protein
LRIKFNALLSSSPAKDVGLSTPQLGFKSRWEQYANKKHKIILSMRKQVKNINMNGHSYIMRSAALNGIRIALRPWRYRAAFAALAVIFFFAYSYLLGDSSLNLGVQHIAFGLGLYAISFAMLIGILLSLSIAINAFAFSNSVKMSAKSGLGAAIAIAIPGALCCTSVIPALLATIGASTPTIIGVTGKLQGPFATYEIPIMLASAALLIISIIAEARKVGRCCVVKK